MSYADITSGKAKAGAVAAEQQAVEEAKAREIIAHYEKINADTDAEIVKYRSFLKGKHALVDKVARVAKESERVYKLTEEIAERERMVTDVEQEIAELTPKMAILEDAWLQIQDKEELADEARELEMKIQWAQEQLAENKAKQTKIDKSLVIAVKVAEESIATLPEDITNGSIWACGRDLFGMKLSECPIDERLRMDRYENYQRRSRGALGGRPTPRPGRTLEETIHLAWGTHVDKYSALDFATHVRNTLRWKIDE